jgi:hypothetical protein
VRIGHALSERRGAIVEGFRIRSGRNKSTKANEHWLEKVENA